MKVTLESTTKVVTLLHEDKEVPARVWQGETEGGIPVQAFITRIAPEVPESDPQIEEKTAEFQRDLNRQADPRPSVEAIPLCFVI